MSSVNLSFCPAKCLRSAYCLTRAKCRQLNKTMVVDYSNDKTDLLRNLFLRRSKTKDIVVSFSLLLVI